VKQAWRHIWRSRRRSILTLCAVLIPVFILVLELGLLNGENKSLFENTVKFETGHFQIQKAGGRPEGGALPLIDDPQEILAVVDRTPGIAWRTVRLDLPALVSNGSRSQGILIQGVVPEEIGQVSPIGKLIAEGTYLRTGEKGVVIGKELSGLLAAKVGDDLVLIGAHPDTGIGAADVPVVGVYTAPDTTLGRTMVQVDLGLAQTLARRPGAATSIVAFASGVAGPWDASKIDRVVQALRARLPADYKVVDFRELAPNLKTFETVVLPIHVLFMAIFFILGGLVVLNTLFLSVMERTRELGLVLALGASRRRVMRMVLTEALLLALVGAGIGALLGAGLVGLAESSGGLKLPGVYSDLVRVMGMEPVIHMRVTLSELVMSGLVMVGVALLAAWVPARRAAALEPVEAMRHVD
jgi:ABC-type lipoprotein release transport system permease subunit